MVKVRIRRNENPSRFRQFLLWFKPTKTMNFQQYADHFYRLKPKVRKKLRKLSTEKTNAKRFAFMIRHYKRIYGPESNIIGHAGLIDGLIKLNLPVNSHVVSYGAGSMHHECFLIKEFPQISSITGVEPLDGMRRLTGKTARNILGTKKSKKIRNLGGSFEQSPKISSGSADAIITNEAFHHVKKPETALKNMASKLKPNGGMVIVYRPNYKTNPPNPNQLASMLRKIGFQVVLNKSLRKDSAEPNNNLHLIVAKKS